MHRALLGCLVTLLFIGLFLASCSGGGNITSPDVPDGPGDTTPAVKDGSSPDESSFRYPWDMGEVIINTEKQTVTVLRPRSLNFNADVLIFMQPPGGPNVIKYKINWAQSNFGNGLVDLDVDITHPFPQNFYWGHDVRLVIIGNGDQAAKSDDSLKYATMDQLRMVNPDGYTRWWNMIEFLDQGNTMFEYHEGQYSIGNFIATATLNPYKYFADSVTKDEYPVDIDEATRGEFRTGKTNSRHMILRFPKPATVDFRFKYIVDASWQVPKDTPVDSSDDFGLQANCREAYQIKIDTTGSLLYYSGPDYLGGELKVKIEIFDWKQAGGSVQDEIGAVILDSPTLFTNYFGFIHIEDTAIVTPGSSPNSVCYTYTVQDCTPASGLDQEFMVIVTDANFNGYAPPDGGTPYPVGEALAAFNLFSVHVSPGPSPTVSVLAPNGGEELAIGGSYYIYWTSNGSVPDVKIEYSEDGGTTFPHTIIDSTVNDGSYEWNPIPDTPTTQAIVRVSKVGDATVSDVSDLVFSIAKLDTITVIQPNGGESLEIGGSYQIQWSSTGSIDEVLIEYSTDGGQSFPHVIANSEPNDGEFDWDPIPDTPTGVGIIKISDASAGEVYDISDDIFEITSSPKNIKVIIPNGSEQWQAGSSQEITWSSEGDITTVKIEYFKDDDYGNAVVIVDETENDGSFDWEPIPDDPTDAAKVRVSDADDSGIYDDSDAFFEIQAEPSTIEVTHPNGGESWMEGTAQGITWLTTGDITDVRIEYYKDDDYVTAIEIIDSTPNTGLFEWFPIPHDQTTTAKVRVSDADAPATFDDSDGFFEIAVIPKYIEVFIPNGGEVWGAGSYQEITWLADGPIGELKIEYYKDDDYDGTAVTIVDATPNDGLFEWDPVPDDPTTTARVRVSDAGEPDVYDDSDEYFQITGGGPKSITVLIPTLGQKWVIDEDYDILWEWEGIFDWVKIEYYKDGDYDGTAVEIHLMAGNNGVYEWEYVPDDPTDTAQIRISDKYDPGVYGDSDVFTITDDPGWERTGMSFLNPQPDQGANPPDLSVHNQQGAEFSRGQIAVQDGQNLTFYMFNDSYTSVIGQLTSSTSGVIDITDYNRFDQPILWDDVLALSNSNEVSPFPGNQFNDPGHSFVYFLNNIPDPDPNAGTAIDGWIYGDGDPEGDVPPDNDPDNLAWLHTTDWDSGVAGGFTDDPEQDEVLLYTASTYSEHPGQPKTNDASLVYIFWADTGYHPGVTTGIGLPNMVTGGGDPGYIDDSEPDIWRLAVDDNTHLWWDGYYPVTTWYFLDSMRAVHMAMVWYNYSIPSYMYRPFGEDFLGPEGNLGIDFAGEAVDICMMPASEFGLDTWNWLTVLVDNGHGWFVKIYSLDFIGPDPENPELVITVVHTTDLLPGTPYAIDVDNFDMELHVLYYYDSVYSVARWQNMEW